MNTHPYSIEPLEDRIAPAGLVTVTYTAATGELTLTGDAAANQASVFLTGPNTYRIEGFATDINAVGVTFLDIGKLTKLTINGGDSSDSFNLLNLRTLSSLSLSGGIGDDTFSANNLTVSGATELHGNAGADSVIFDGVSTLLNGTLTVDSAAAATDNVSVGFNGQKTVVGGIVTFTGGGGLDAFDAFGEGPATFSKGIDFNAGAGGGGLRLEPDGVLAVGKLTTGESILFVGGDGDDDLTVDGIDSTLAGGIRMTGGNGSNTITFAEDASTVKVGKLATGQSILFTGGTGDDSISINAFNTNLSGGIELAGADGTNSVDLAATGGVIKIGKLATGESVKMTGTTGDDSFSSSSANLSFAGGVVLDAGAGTNSIAISGLNGKTVIGKTATGVSLSLTGLAGADTISTDVADLNLAGGVVMNGGDGTNRIDLLGTSGKGSVGKSATGQSILYTGGTGSDTINTTISNFTLKGGIEFTGGDGTNLLTLNSPQGIVNIGKLAAGQSILFNGGAGSDDIASNLGHVTLSGGIEHNGAGGDNDLEFDDNGFVKIGTFGAGISVNFISLAASNADNEIDFGGLVTIAGSVNVVGGTGSDDIDFDGKVTVGKDAAGVSVSMVGNDGTDDIDFSDNITLAGSLKHDGGNGDDNVDFNSVDTFTIKGAVEFIGGAGADTFDLVSFQLVLGSTLTVTGGDDADDFILRADGSVAGDVNVDLGLAAAGTQPTTFASRTGLPGGLALKGALTVNATAAATADFLTITNVSVAKLIDLKLGDGVSTVNIDNLIAGDEFKLDTRGGADVVNIERGNFFGGSVIKKLATIQLGIGDDQLLIGNPLPAVVAPFPDHTRVNFLGGLNADGGVGGSDNRNDIVGENDGVLIAGLIGFELSTLV